MLVTSNTTLWNDYTTLGICAYTKVALPLCQTLFHNEELIIGVRMSLVSRCLSTNQ